MLRIGYLHVVSSAEVEEEPAVWGRLTWGGLGVDEEIRSVLLLRPAILLIAIISKKVKSTRILHWLRYLWRWRPKVEIKAAIARRASAN